MPSGGYLPQFKSGMAGAIARAHRPCTGGRHRAKARWFDVSTLEVSANYLETTLILYTYQGIVRGPYRQHPFTPHPPSATCTGPPTAT